MSEFGSADLRSVAVIVALRRVGAWEQQVAGRLPFALVVGGDWRRTDDALKRLGGHVDRALLCCPECRSNRAFAHGLEEGRAKLPATAACHGEFSTGLFSIDTYVNGVLQV